MRGWAFWSLMWRGFTSRDFSIIPSEVLRLTSAHYAYSYPFNPLILFWFDASFKDLLSSSRYLMLKDTLYMHQNVGDSWENTF